MDRFAPRPAATIVVIRNESELLEILMLRRHDGSRFAPGAHVFPGGVVDQSDYDVVRRGLVAGRDENVARRVLHLGEGALAYYCAAVRELFEESGVLVTTDDVLDVASLGPRVLEGWREELEHGAVGWADLLAREGLRLAVRDVEYWAHWVTPRGRSRRFDTRFFVVRAPEEHGARPDGREVVDAVWVSATEALVRHRRGEWALLHPTIRTLEELEGFRRVDDVLAHATRREVVRIEPQEIIRDGKVVIVGPDDPGYVA